MKRLRVTVAFDIMADPTDDDEIKEEVEYALQNMLDSEEVPFEVEEADEEEEEAWQ